jgi:hypothetical protein
VLFVSNKLTTPEKKEILDKMTLNDKSDTTENFRLEAIASLPDLNIKE